MKLTTECLGMLMSAGVFTLSHSEDPNRLYGIFIDGIFTSEERARCWLRNLCDKHNTNIYFIHRFSVNSGSREELFRGRCKEA